MRQSIKKQQGLTFIELMIAMLLGLVIIYAVANIMVSNNQTATIAETAAQAQDNGRFAMSYLSRRILRAGYMPDMPVVPPQPFADLCDDNNQLGQYGMCSENQNNDGQGEESTGDKLAIVRTADDNLSCFGTQLREDAGAGAPVTTEPRVVDVFWVEESNNISSLYCQTFAQQPATLASTNALSSKQPIVAGIAAMHILYGIATQDQNSVQRRVSRYVAPEQLPNRTANNFEKNWQQVEAVKVAILTEAFDEMRGLSGDRSYILLDSAPYTYSDQIIRQVFSTTIARANFGGAQ